MINKTANQVKIIIISDNHGAANTIDKILNKYWKENDIVLHCGDSLLSQDAIDNRINYIVCGNNDFYSNDFAPTQIISINKKRILLCHGHTFFSFGGYNPNYDKLVKLMVAEKLDLFVHGHLHIPIVKFYKEKLFLCPGSTDYPRNGLGPTFLMLKIELNKYIINLYSAKSLLLLKEYEVFL